MRLTKLKANDFSQTLKATIQKTGKLGFTNFTANQLSIDTDTYVNFYLDEDAPQSPILVFSKTKSVEAFQARVSGGYYSLSTTALFAKLGFEFKKNNIICDLNREEQADEFVGGEAYRLVVRPIKRRHKSTQLEFDLEVE